MKGKSEINRIIGKSKKLIEDFTSSTIDHTEAVKRYDSIFAEYETARSKVMSTNTNPDILKSLCYQHNCENYSIFTGIFMIFQSKIVKLNYAGNNPIAAKILKLLPDYLNVKHNAINPIETETGRYYMIRFTHNDEELIFISQSSSSYFSTDRFMNFFKTVKNILPSENKSTADIFSIYENIIRYIDRNCNEDFIFACYLYSFPELSYIFGHMGPVFMKDLNWDIKKTLGNEFNNAEIFHISGKDFAVFEKKERNSNLKKEISAPRIFFHCRNIPIPYLTKALYVFEKSDFYKMLNMC